MSKRRLNKQQQRRISTRQLATQDKARRGRHPTEESVDEATLGPEKPGLVISHFGQQADIECFESHLIHRCHLRANLDAIVAGDEVVWRDGQSEGVVVARKERRSTLMRPDSFGKMKLVAANIDRILIVIAPQPEAFSNLIDRYLVVAESHELDIHLVINKSDMTDQLEHCNRFRQKYSQLGYPVHHCSTKCDEQLTDIKQVLENGCNIFVGQSGVGKSSIINQLLPDKDIRIGKLSHAEKKGRHTTTYARLYHFKEGGSCIDSPGIREFGLWHLEFDQICHGFVEFRPFLGQCQFRDCRHKNEPKCAIQNAVKSGDISKERFDSFTNIVESLDQVNIISSAKDH